MRFIEDLDDIRELLGTRIFNRARDYYRTNRINGLSISGDHIEALVSGSRKHPYSVKIQLESEEFFCDCPYPHECKHIGAVLIYLHYNSFITPHRAAVDFNTLNQVGDSIEAQPDKIIPLTRQSKKGSDTVEDIFSIYREPPPTSALPDKRFRLVFCVENSEFSDGHILVPKLQFIKKDGTPGRLENFRHDRVTEPIGETEHHLLISVLRHSQNRAPLEQYLPFIVSHSDIGIFTKQGSETVAITHSEIEWMEISFRLSGIQNDIPTFTPEFLLFTGDESPPVDVPKAHSLILRGLLIYTLTEDGTLFYAMDNSSFASVIGIFKRKWFLAHEQILTLREYTESLTSRDISIKYNLKKVRLIHSRPSTVLELWEKGSGLEIIPYFTYNDRVVLFGHSSELLILSNEVDDEELKVSVCSVKYEKMMIEVIKNIFSKASFPSLNQRNPIYNNYDSSSNTILISATVYEFLASFGSGLIENNVEIRLGKSKEKISSASGRISTIVSSGIDWLDLETKFTNDKGESEAIEIDPVLLATGMIKINDSYTVLSKEDIEKLLKFRESGMSDEGKLRVPRTNFGLIEELYEALGGDERENLEDSHAIYKKLKNFKKIKHYALPKKFVGTLRPYQRAGFDWLNFIRQYSLNGCLADDMGLGKTIQALALLQSLKEKKELGLSLIIAPVTTLPNWASEIERFTPELSFVKHIGGQRIKDAAHLEKFNLVLTSYHTLGRDIELFHSIPFDYLILDESQNIKNAATRAFKAVKTIQAGNRLTLTGTPIENNTLELWSQIDFLNPGLLGSKKEFQTRFARPIEKYQDKDAVEKLRRITFPFILRRKKEDVAPDLPEKEEIILYLEMKKEQREIYNGVKNFYRGKIENSIEEKGIGRSSMEIFKALLRLRQAALFPSLISDEYRDVESCKFEALKKMINEVMEEDHQALIFSQFVQSLKIIRRYIKEQGFGFSYLDGSTRKREEQIKRFEEDEAIRLFLLSIKAGGVGINLTAADYVILFDPWWNPAVESQAIDRAHRIGQTRKVIAYKLIVRDSIEEKILVLQERKKNLVKELITEDTSFFKSLTRKDVIAFFD